MEKKYKRKNARNREPRREEIKEYIEYLSCCDNYNFIEIIDEVNSHFHTNYDGSYIGEIYDEVFPEQSAEQEPEPIVISKEEFIRKNFCILNKIDTVLDMVLTSIIEKIRRARSDNGIFNIENTCGFDPLEKKVYAELNRFRESILRSIVVQFKDEDDVVKYNFDETKKLYDKALNSLASEENN